MENAPSSPKEQGPQGDQSRPLLSQLSAYELARMIRDLDSQLIEITDLQDGDETVLVYTFLAAGQTQRFRIKIAGQQVTSIVDLYPAAQPFEEELQRRLGLTFVPPCNQ